MTAPSLGVKLADNVKRFIDLFAGNDRSSGRYNPQTERMHVEYAPIGPEDVESHLAGTVGVGVVPIRDDGKCTWGAIDIDNHGSDEDLPIHEVDKIIEQEALPLVACRSKSGGIHAYVFFRSAQSAARVRGLLADWAVKLGYPGSEVFPKQSKLTSSSSDGKLSYGNWINLPYFGGDKTMRYAIVDGKKLEFEQFLDHAEHSRLSDAKVKALYISENPEAPPCVQTLLAKGAPQGQRNEAMYNLAVYFRKLDPNTAEEKAKAINQFVFHTPLPKAELMRTVQSAMKPEYSYRCGQEVIKKHCDREACIKRKCGITVDEADKADKIDALPTFSDLAKYMTEPVRWEMVVNGVRIFNIDTMQLLDWRAVRQLIADRLTMIVPMIKNSEWERILRPLMESARIVETPDDASVNGVIRDRLREFCSKADLISRGENNEDRKTLLRGMPVVQVMDGERCVMFRGQDFVQYLKRTRSEELRGPNLWFAVQDMGVLHRKVRIGGTKDSCNVWYLPVKTVVQELAAEPVEFKAEL